jgi:hypothetical protein
MMIPGLKVVAPSTPRDVVGLMAASIRDPDPVVFMEHKSLMAHKGEVPDGEVVDELGKARIARAGTDVTIAALALMVPRALEAADRLAADGISAEVIDVRSLVPLDTQALLSRWRRRDASSPSRRIPGCVVGGPNWSPSSTRKPSGISTAPASGSPPHTSRCRQQPPSRTSLYRPPTASTRPSVSPWTRE